MEHFLQEGSPYALPRTVVVLKIAMQTMVRIIISQLTSGMYTLFAICDQNKLSQNLHLYTFEGVPISPFASMVDTLRTVCGVEHQSMK